MPTEAPVNQVPYERDFLNHACTFAHELLTDFHPHAPRLRHIDSWNAAPDLELDVDSIERNRVGMRYYRGVLGYFYDRSCASAPTQETLTTSANSRRTGARN